MYKQVRELRYLLEPCVFLSIPAYLDEAVVLVLMQQLDGALVRVQQALLVVASTGGWPGGRVPSMAGWPAGSPPCMDG